MLTLSPDARMAMLEALASSLDGGYLRVYSGVRPSGPSYLPGDPAQLIVELALKRPCWHVVEANRVTMRTDGTGRATNGGRPRWWRCVTAAGVPKVDGSAGVIGMPEVPDLVFTRDHIEKGDVVEVEGVSLRLP